MSQNIIILKPIITEKALAAQQLQDKYAFWVAPQVSKNQIAVSFQTVFGIKPISIQTLTLKGKFKTNWKTRKTAQKSDRKKAIITLPKGTKLELLKLNTK
ncbi:MAG: 50S ribosomal protein L23 [Candidatus Shapirobacteria bacterium]|nr:50S ribosomal protein L23 [Candidatus Shapirobacteria bacterium]